VQGFLTRMSFESSSFEGPDVPNRLVLLPGVAERLRTARTAIGLQQIELAEASGVWLSLGSRSCPRLRRQVSRCSCGVWS
jgi:hypothetical protein